MNSLAPESDRRLEFRNALGQFATGVTVITCQSPFGPLGITANSFASVSLDPPLVLWSPARSSARFQSFVAADRFAIHVLAREQQDLCQRFAGDGLEFEGIAWTGGYADVPILTGCLAVFECVRHAVHDGGDHAIVVGEVQEFFAREGSPLVFSGGTYSGIQG